MTTEEELARLQKKYKRLRRHFIIARRVARKVEQLYEKLAVRYERVLKERGMPTDQGGNVTGA